MLGTHAGLASSTSCMPFLLKDVFMKKSVNYRTEYERIYGKIPEGFVIHHIDGNRNNNEISNLIMIPNKLHAKYHMSKSMSSYIVGIEIPIGKYSDCELIMVKHYIDSLIEINSYLNLKYMQDMAGVEYAKN